MQTTTALWTKDAGWTLPISPAGAPQLVLYFGATSQLDDGAPAIHELVARCHGLAANIGYEHILM